MTVYRRAALTVLMILLTPWPSAARDNFVDLMAREHAGDTPEASPATRVEPAGEVEGSEVTYGRIGDAEVRGYLARPAGDGPFPGIIVIHEWWGLNDNIRAMADRLAGEGYLALAVDLYEGGVATDREGAMSLMRDATRRPERLEEHLRQAREHLASSGATRVGSIGWCFGGGWSLRAAIVLGDKLDAAVVYYGRLITDPVELGPVSAPVLGLFGEADDGIPVDSVRAFESAMRGLGKPVSIHVYPGADHAFANPSGTRYDEAAATDAWTKTLTFLEQHLAGSP